MSVCKIGFVGFRSRDLDGLRNVLVRGLGLTPTDVAADKVRYSLGDDTRLAGYSEANSFHAFFTTGPVVGFQVEDFDESWARLKDLGIVRLTDVQVENGQAWVHFRLPDVTIAELIGSTVGGEVDSK
jgi:hypothetical protein